MGDLLCSIPAIRSVRFTFPEAKVILIGLPGAVPFSKRFSHYFDDIMIFPGYPGLPEQSFDSCKFEEFLLKIRQENFDLILQMQGNGSIVNNLIQSFNAKCTAGFCQDIRQENELFKLYPDYGHELSRHLSLMEYIGIPPAGNEMEFPVNDQDEESLKKLKLKIKPEKYICIHPGSRGVWRQWPTVYFAAMADYCIDNGYEIVITGTKEELKLAKEVASYMKYKPIISSGKTDLGSLGLLIKQSFALIANCTGVSHIAAALQTPSIIISMDGEPERWAPVNKELHHTIDWTVITDYDFVLEKLKLLLSNNKSRTASTICQVSGNGNSL
ncbi:glycosyltransferase family 9 protein [Pedobacter lusitanus]|uniref:glycosyltransferase family 9 protein n=1 Tax=Pedobacter lusitanus TaxID=1503925 RepID=UPI001F2D6D98|nr:glycosyltransferase family 9 protein [Pedobacter lusitanus]